MALSVVVHLLVMKLKIHPSRLFFVFAVPMTLTARNSPCGTAFTTWISHADYHRKKTLFILSSRNLWALRILCTVWKRRQKWLKVYFRDTTSFRSVQENQIKVGLIPWDYTFRALRYSIYVVITPNFHCFCTKHRYVRYLHTNKAANVLCKIGTVGTYQPDSVSAMVHSTEVAPQHY